ncbi:MAG: hypothetical protein ACRCYW_04420 [Aeromonas sp.]|uniref:hypothetical protein n=1 Tax=Aeromonas sp. TaxID=647 RepID=UPI003F3E5639
MPIAIPVALLRCPFLQKAGNSFNPDCLPKGAMTFLAHACLVRTDKTPVNQGDKCDVWHASGHQQKRLNPFGEKSAAGAISGGLTIQSAVA